VVYAKEDRTEHLDEEFITTMIDEDRTLSEVYNILTTQTKIVNFM